MKANENTSMFFCGFERFVSQNFISFRFKRMFKLIDLYFDFHLNDLLALVNMKVFIYVVRKFII